MKIVGIAGTNGSGKDTLGEIMAQDFGWLFVSVSDLLRRQLKKQNLPIERNNLRDLSAEWRRKLGNGVLIDKALEIYKNKPGFKGLAISSLRNFGEADRVHQLGGIVVWLDAEPQLRYQRIYSRRRGSEDQKTFEQFLAEEAAERHHSTDQATLNWQGVKDRADIFISNDSNSMDRFGKTVQEALKDIL